MAESRRKHSDEFKREAVRLTYEPGRSVAAVATDLGIDRSLLTRWRVQMRPNDVAEAVVHTGKPRTTSDEIQHLRRELARVTEEREILKKALAFFAKHRG
jgi:transposase